MTRDITAAQDLARDLYKSGALAVAWPCSCIFDEALKNWNNVLKNVRSLIHDIQIIFFAKC